MHSWTLENLKTEPINKTVKPKQNIYAQYPNPLTTLSLAILGKKTHWILIGTYWKKACKPLSSIILNDDIVFDKPHASHKTTLCINLLKP